MTHLSNPRAVKWEPKQKGLSQPTGQLTWALEDAPGRLEAISWKGLEG